MTAGIRVAALAVAIACGGCAMTLHYSKPGASDEELQRTLAGCKVQAAMVPEQGAVGAMIAGQTRDNCMRAQGWVRTD